ncbi:MAG TPA: calcium-binding protein [Crinalium sp.]|jgi:Ca2+-binding RTX toxin-like protein
MATVVGNASNNTIKGSSGADDLSGLRGDDTLLGRAGDDILKGGIGSDRLEGSDGNDVLDGGSSKDTLIGGRGDDTYVVNGLGDRVVEAPNEGLDTVQSTVSYKLGANLENLTLIGSKPSRGTGNSGNNIIIGNNARNILKGLAGDDRIDGGRGNDVLDGGIGNDILVGGLGNDVYVINSTSDRIFENPGQGIDRVDSLVSFTLTDGLDNLTLLGTGSASGIGNALRNVLVGNSGNNGLSGEDGADDLTGGGGNDVLTGGAGLDLFIYDTRNPFADADIGFDTITDFTRNEDLIVVSRRTFGLTSDSGFGFSASSEFAAVSDNKAAETSAARIVFSRSTGTLFYNTNGTNGGFGSSASSGSFAVLQGISNLAGTDFLIKA